MLEDWQKISQGFSGASLGSQKIIVPGFQQLFECQVLNWRWRKNLPGLQKGLQTRNQAEFVEAQVDFNLLGRLLGRPKVLLSRIRFFVVVRA